MGLVTAKLEETAAHVVALSILPLNLRKIQCAFWQFWDWLVGFLQPCEIMIYLSILPCCSTAAETMLNLAGDGAQFARSRCSIQSGILNQLFDLILIP